MPPLDYLCICQINKSPEIRNQLSGYMLFAKIVVVVDQYTRLYDKLINYERVEHCQKWRPVMGTRK